MKSILASILLIFCLDACAQSVTGINPSQAYQGQSLYTTITSSSLFLTGSSPQGNVMSILLKNANDSVFAISDSTNVINANTSTTFWSLPANLATGLYTLIVRVYNNLFTGPTTDYSLNNAFTVTAAAATISGTVYDDLNQNGIRDAGEPGIGGYTVYLSPLGNMAITDSNGNYTLGTVPGLDTVIVRQPLDDIYEPSVPVSHILNVPIGATTGQDFGLVKDRYLISMTPVSDTVGQIINATILSSKVFKNEIVSNIALRFSVNHSLIYGYSSFATDTNHCSSTFNLNGSPYTGYYDLVVVVRSTLNNNLRTFILDSAITLVGPTGYISGFAFSDSNSNGIKDPGEQGKAGQYVYISGSSGYSASVLTDSNGFYEFHTLPSETYNVTVTNPYSYYASCGSNNLTYTTATSYTITIHSDTITGDNFGSHGISSPQFDLFIHPGWRPANPGFVRHYWIYYGNYSYPTVPVSGAVITMQYDPTLVFDSSDRLPSSHDLITHTLTWNIGSVPGIWIGGWNDFNLYFTVPVTDTSGELLYSYFSISPTAGDCSPGDNTVTDVSPVTSSRDPNEKHANPYGGLIKGQDSIVTYTINFQNTGTASTHFVIVRDTLDSNLDYKTVVATGGSGPFRFDNNNGILTFTFDPLILTDSSTDEKHSHGFVSYKVKVKPSTPIGTTIRNTASIYFDYNTAVATNTAINEVATALAVKNVNASAMNVVVSPNPFEESTVLSFSNPAHDKCTLILYDLTGKTVRVMSGFDTEFIIEKNSLPSGVYMYKLMNQNTKLSAQGKVVAL